jgi:CheY-like chemotaxis protein
MAGELILIVDDDELNLELAQEVLEPKGYRTVEARTAAEAIALASEHMPDLVLMDIRLPDGDGVTALERLRADTRTESLTVVALTASAMPDDRQRLLEVGFNGYMSKPIDVGAFPRQIEAFLGSS